MLGGDKTTVQLGQSQWPVKVFDAPGESTRTGIAIGRPDLIQGHTQFVFGKRLPSTEKAPEQFGRVDEPADRTAAWSDVEQYLHTLQGQPGQTGITALETNTPDATQVVGQTLAGRVEQIDRGLTWRDGLVLARQFTVCVISRGDGSAGKRQARYEPSSRNRHRPTCVSLEAGSIPARTLNPGQNLASVSLQKR